MGTALQPSIEHAWVPTAQPIEHELAKNTVTDKEVVSTSISQAWTDQAVKCYLTKADCSNCSVFRGNYSFTCQMNKVIPILLENLGEPDPVRVEKILPFIYD